MVKNHIKLAVLSAILTMIISASLLAGNLVGTSAATALPKTSIAIGLQARDSRTFDVHTALIVGNDGALYVTWKVGREAWNTPVGISAKGLFPPGAGIGIVATDRPQSGLSGIIAGNDGALYVVTVQGRHGKWSEPVAISPKGMFPAGAGIAMAEQTPGVYTALGVGNDGGLYVSWQVVNGKWQGPLGISPKGIFPAGADIAMAKQTANVLTALAVGNDGNIHMSWVVGNGKWQGPLAFTHTPKGLFPPGADITMDKQTPDVLSALTVGNDGILYVSWVVGTGKWNTIGITPRERYIERTSCWPIYSIILPPGARVGMAVGIMPKTPVEPPVKNFYLDAYLMDNNGRLYNAWVRDSGVWNKPELPPFDNAVGPFPPILVKGAPSMKYGTTHFQGSISGKGLFPPNTGIAAVHHVQAYTLPHQNDETIYYDSYVYGLFVDGDGALTWVMDDEGTKRTREYFLDWIGYKPILPC